MASGIPTSDTVNRLPRKGGSGLANAAKDITLSSLADNDLLQWNSTTRQWENAQPGVTFVSSTFRVYDSGDNTKLLAYDVSGVTTGTTRTWTAQDADGTVAFLGDSPFSVTFGDGANTPDNNGASSAHFINGLQSMQTPVPTTNATQARLVVTRRSSAAATGYSIELMYVTAYESTPGNFLQAASSPISVVCDTANTIHDTGWFNLVPGAIGDDIVFCPIVSNGDGSADPNFGVIAAWFR